MTVHREGDTARPSDCHERYWVGGRGEVTKPYRARNTRWGKVGAASLPMRRGRPRALRPPANTAEGRGQRHTFT